MAPKQHSTILLVEDSLSLAQLYAQYLADESYNVVHAESGAQAMAFLAERTPDAILLDLRLPDMDGMDILRHVRDRELPAEVIVATAHGSVSLAVEAMRGGAYDFLLKPFTAERLVVTLRNALEHRRLFEIVETYREDIAPTRFQGFIGGSLGMQAVYRIIRSAAPSQATVFITGESGTGKELCAQAIHVLSSRAEGPFVAINCGAIPHNLMESEIFGHVRGAFTGAIADRQGAAGRADGGTLFLDEIGEMDLALQTKLLRFVQTGTFTKVGGTRTEAVGVRIVCATNVDPLQRVKEGRFREDLYYRLHVIPIHLPPLREREDDVLLIAQEFLVGFAAEEGKRFERFSPEVEIALQSYGWPGNVRELENVIRNIVVLNDGKVVLPEMLPQALEKLCAATRPPAGGHIDMPAAAIPAPDPGAGSGAESEDTIRPLWRVEKEAIEQAIERCDGNIPRAAAMLGISASTVYRKRQAWEAEGK